jgi:hypothetical protein
MPIGGDAYSASMRWQPTHQWSVFHLFMLAMPRWDFLSISSPMNIAETFYYISIQERKGKKDEKEQGSNKAHMTINIHHQGLENP